MKNRADIRHSVVDIDSVICWHVVSPYRAAYGISNVNIALIERARESCPLPARIVLKEETDRAALTETTLRQVVGSRLLQTVVTDREGLAAEIQDIVSCSFSSGSAAVAHLDVLG